MAEYPDTTGEAAQTGTMLHRIIERWHGGESVDDAIARTEQEVPSDFPLAKGQDAARWARAYAADPRNTDEAAIQYGRVLPEWQEKELVLRLPPAVEDHTGQDVVLIGHCDQIRVHPHDKDDLAIWDLKTSRDTTVKVLYDYAAQLSLYALAATAQLGRPVRPGGLITVKGYDRKVARLADAPVFHEAAWTLKDCDAIADAVRSRVANIRAGRLNVGPGLWCKWCPLGAPQHCLPLIGQETEKHDDGKQRRAGCSC